jgi:hypothetical protein
MASRHLVLARALLCWLQGFYWSIGPRIAFVASSADRFAGRGHALHWRPGERVPAQKTESGVAALQIRDTSGRLSLRAGDLLAATQP